MLISSKEVFKVSLILDAADVQWRLIAAWSGLQSGNRPVAWTAEHLCENWWTTYRHFEHLL